MASWEERGVNHGSKYLYLGKLPLFCCSSRFVILPPGSSPTESIIHLVLNGLFWNYQEIGSDNADLYFKTRSTSSWRIGFQLNGGSFLFHEMVMTEAKNQNSQLRNTTPLISALQWLSCNYFCKSFIPWAIQNPMTQQGVNWWAHCLHVNLYIWFFFCSNI